MHRVSDCICILVLCFVSGCNSTSLNDVLTSGTDMIQVFRVSNDTIKSTKVRFYHLPDLDPKLPALSLVRIEHDSKTATMMMNHAVTCEHCVTEYRANSMNFVINNFDDILSIVGDLRSRRHGRGLNADTPASTLSDYCHQDDGDPGFDHGSCRIPPESADQLQFIDLGADPDELFYDTL